MTDTHHAFTFADILHNNALQRGSEAALIENGHVISHSELDERTSRLAANLSARGVEPGDCIALLLYDGVPFVELLLAAGKLGAIAVLLNWRLAKPEIAALVERVSPRILFHSHGLADLASTLDGTEPFVCADRYDPADAYGQLASEGDSAFTPQTDPDAPFFIMFTSGTTGVPKACMHSQTTAIQSGVGYAQGLGIRPSDRLFCSNPLFHVAGLQAMLSAICTGGSASFAARDAAPEDILALCHADGCTHATLNMPLIMALRLGMETKADAPPFRVLMGGAGIGDPDLYRALASYCDCELWGGYGQTEICGFATAIDLAGMIAHPTSIGWALPHIKLAALDDDGNPIETLECEGEIGMRGPSVMIGYRGNEQATDDALGTGWLRSGDIAARDEHGLLSIRGRSKELIKTGGENVYPVEVEKVLLTHPKVADAAIAGVPNRKWGEAVKAFIVPEPGEEVSGEELVALCREHIAGYKRPRFLETVDAIPRDHLGKIQRLKLTAREVTPDQAI